MKKSRLLLSVISCLALTGCTVDDLMFWKKKNNEPEQQEEKKWDLNPTIEGGTEEEKFAILDTLNNKPICNQNGKKSTEIFYDVPPTLLEDDGDGLKLTTKQVQSAGQVVLTWEIDETQPYFGGRLQSDEAHDIIDIKYQGYGVPNGEFKWSLTSLVCGEAHTVGFKLDYTAVTKNQVYKHDDVKIADIYKMTQTRKVIKDKSNKIINMWESTFDMIDYSYDPDASTYSPYYITNNPDAAEKQYLYYNVSGKVIYTAPDGNWGLLADGKNVLEFYAGSGTALTEKNFPNLANKYVKISANMGQYCGNVQIGFVTKIAALTAEEKAQIAEPEPLAYTEMTEELLNSLHYRLSSEELTALGLTAKENYECEQQVVKLADGTCLSNALAQVSGELVAGSLKDKDGAAVAVNALSSGARYTFQIKVGDEVLTIAYDYHTDKTGKNGLFNAMKAALNAGGAMTIKGTMRYSGNNSGPFISVGNKGVWNLVPFEVAHFA